MHIKYLGIRNFRNFLTAKFQFVDKAVNTILGENASGKTNVFHAMRLVLDDSLPRNAGFLSANDFNRKLGEIRGHWIVIELTFGGLGLTDDELVMANHVMEGETGELEGTYTFVYRPKIHIRQELFNISQAEPIEANRLQAVEDYLKTLVIGKDDYEAVAFTRTTVDFTDDNVYAQLVGDFARGIYSNPQDEDAALIGSLKPAYFSLIKEVTCTYVKALRNVVNDLKYAKTNPLYRLLSYKSAEITGAESITDNVKQLNADISDLEQVKDLSKSIARTLSGAVGQTYSPDINISSDLPEEITELVQSLSLLVEDSLGYQGS
ncbi:MAG: AAA family ATPase [Candidatus Thiodiazotropha sp. (ex Lucinoma kastoroae)]|nr:AAA family ATPase [Candidatus Thiodiazotropha sp. (ex Lucinoma kastoroae)]